MRTLILGGNGYIGCRLYEFLTERDYEVWVCDTARPILEFENYNKQDYRFYRFESLSHFDNIILLAGYSSVLQCKNNRNSEVMRNNVFNFVSLLDKLDRQKLIYASSASVYDQKHDADESDASFTASNVYDLTKFEIDSYAQMSDIEFYGLRFGTVNGFSQNLRTDIMINRMVTSIKDNKRIEVANPDILRPILGISDLCDAVRAILESQEDKRGLYNLASFNMRVGDIAAEIASIKKVPVINYRGDKAYDFSISTDKFSKNYDFTFIDSVKSITDELFAYTAKVEGPRI
jgi:nucleoside-diphosphate-sugar epimerase